VFCVEGVVLKRVFYRDKKVLYAIFSKEYGKITVWAKQNKFGCFADIGAIINCSVTTRRSINEASAVKIKQSVNAEQLHYEEVFHLLQLLAMYDTLLPENLPYHNLYVDYIHAMSTLENPKYNHLAIELLKLKIIKMTGIGDLEIIDRHEEIKKIYAHIETKRMSGLPLQEFLEKNILFPLKTMNASLLNTYL